MHERQLEAEGGRLGVNAVAAADARREHVLFRPARDDFPQLLHAGDQDVGALDYLHGEGGVHDVAAGEAEVQPAAGGGGGFFFVRGGGGGGVGGVGFFVVFFLFYHI